MRTTRRPAAIAALAATLVLPASPAGAQESIDYVALGDSYSSGTGAGPYFDADCERSERAYPALLAEDLGAELTFEACSGATTGDLLDEQAAALGEGTDLVTMTVGGNDIGWSDAVTACLIPTYDCTPDIERAERNARDELPDDLAEVHAAISERSPRAEVFVLGYPRLFAAEGSCGAFGLISVGEQKRMNDAADLLAEIVEAAAISAGLNYVEVRDDFDGHGVCGSDEWIHGLSYPVGESYHPNRAGHAEGYLPAIAAAL